MIKKLIINIIHLVKDIPTTEKMVEDFIKIFPDRCIVCSYWRYGLREGHTTIPFPAPHKCIEGEPLRKKHNLT